MSKQASQIGIRATYMRGGTSKGVFSLPMTSPKPHANPAQLATR